MKISAVCLCLVACVCLLVSSASAASEPKLAGSFNVTGYLEPGHVSPFTWCFNFTTTGGVLGFSNSGTWNVPSYGDWNGDWYQVGDEIVMHGVAGGTFLFSWRGLMITNGTVSGRYSEFLIDGTTDTAGTFVANKVHGACSTASTSKRGDPAK